MMTLMQEEFDAARAMKIINHPVRVRIIELLASGGPMSWKELSGQVGTRTGALYHHLDALEQVITKDSSKKYTLTKLGESVYHYLEQNPSSRNAEEIGKVIRQRTLLSVVAGFFIPRSLIHFITSSRSRSATSALLVSVVVGGLVILSENQITLFSFSPSDGPVQSVGTFVGSLLAISGFGYAALRATGEKANPMVLLASSSLSFLPLADFSLVVRSLGNFGLSGIVADRTLLTVVFAFFQAWGAGIVGAGMSVASSVRIEKTLLLSLVLLYASMIILFVQGGRLT